MVGSYPRCKKRAPMQVEGTENSALGGGSVKEFEALINYFHREVTFSLSLSNELPQSTLKQHTFIIYSQVRNLGRG